MHYGEALITELKKNGRYGSFFSYEEYQALHRAASLAELESVLKRTRFADCLFCGDVSIIYRDMALAEEQLHLSEDRASIKSPSFLTNLLELELLAPLSWSLGSLWSGFMKQSVNRQLDRVQRERAMLRSQYKS